MCITLVMGPAKLVKFYLIKPLKPIVIFMWPVARRLQD